MNEFNVGDRVATGVLAMQGTNTVSKQRTGIITRVINCDGHCCLCELKLDGEPNTIIRSTIALRKLIVEPEYL